MSYKKFCMSLSLALSLFCAIFISITPSVSAAEQTANLLCQGSWTELKWRNFTGSGAQNDVYSDKNRHADIEFSWNFTDPVTSGRSIYINLPKELVPAATNNVNLRDPQGHSVANGTWDGNRFFITATEYANTHSNITGTARLSVEWNHTDEAVKKGGRIGLNFTGCGSGNLLGDISPDGPPGFHHSNGKQGAFYPNDSSIVWSIGVNGNDLRGKNFVVTDTAPEGWKFQCDPLPNEVALPTYVKTLITLPENHPLHAVNQAVWMDHVVFLSDNHHPFTPYNPNNIWGYAGQLSSEVATARMKEILFAKEVNMSSYHFADFNQYAYFKDATWKSTPDAYKISCSDNKITASFPYGISTKYDIVIQTKTVPIDNEKTPEPNSIVTNQVQIDNKLYEGDVFIPGASGDGKGLLGGFVIGKRVEGISSAELDSKEFEFLYTCTDSLSTVKRGTVRIKANQYKHVKDVGKNSTCTVTEKLESATLSNSQPTVRWQIGRENAAEAKFKIPDSRNEQEYPAVQVTAINSYDPPTTATIQLRKEVVSQDTVGAEDADGWTFILKNNGSTQSVTTKQSRLTEKRSVSSSEKTRFVVPAGSTSTVTITEDTAQKPNYSLKDISCSVTPKVDPETITVTRLTDTSVSVAGIRAGDTVDCVATNEKKKPEPSTGSVSWSKVDSENQAHFLSNSEWLLNHITNGKATDITLITDCTTAPCPTSSSSDPVDTNPEPGKFTITGLPQGKYTLVEKTAPAGYYLSDKTYPFIIGEAPEQLNIALDPIPNTKITPPQLPLTGGTGTLPFVIGGLALIGFAGAIMLRQRLTIK